MSQDTASGAFDLSAYLAREAPPIQAALERAVAAVAELVPEDVAAATAHGVLSDGKRLRPVLCVTAYRACAGGGAPDAAPASAPDQPNRAAAYDLAASLELIHAYSLMHDDLPCMDDAELRRGRPTTHRLHGEDATIRGGAALIAAAALRCWDAALALGCTPDEARRVTAALMEASGGGGMVGGQWVDLEGEQKSLGADELDDLHRRKTGALLEASLLVGGLAARASEDVLAGLATYGQAIGLAFQIADDILDATQDAATLGKNPSDAELEKSTYVALYGLDEARRRAQAQVDRALEALAGVGLEVPALQALARYVVERQH